MLEPVALPLLTLILGGARSGKSHHAMRLAEQSRLAPFYVATGWAGDEEMTERIACHKQERLAPWITLEEQIELPRLIDKEARAERILVIDCLTLWLSNLMAAGRDIEQESDRLAASLATAHGPILIVSNEVGLGIVPETALGRHFRDCQGRLNQRMAQLAQSVILIAAGLPLQLKASMSKE